MSKDHADLIARANAYIHAHDDEGDERLRRHIDLVRDLLAEANAKIARVTAWRERYHRRLGAERTPLRVIMADEAAHQPLEDEKK
jgi:hypothetical protein